MIELDYGNESRLIEIYVEVGNLFSTTSIMMQLYRRNADSKRPFETRKYSSLTNIV